MDLVGVIPAAGRGTRLGRLPQSKEILPLGQTTSLDLLLRSMGRAGIDRAWMVLREGKWDIPAHLQNRRDLPNLAYLVVDHTPSVPHTLDQAYAFLRDKRTALGFPDILIHPPHALAAVREAQERSSADLVLGLFPTSHAHRADMVELDSRGRIKCLKIKEKDSGLEFTWSLAIWTPDFTQLLHQVIQDEASVARGRELYVGDVVQRAIEQGMQVESVTFPKGDSFDIGTPAALENARRRLTLIQSSYAETAE